MTLALGLAAVAAVLVFVAWMIRREKLSWARTLRAIRALPEFQGQRRVRQ